MFKLIFTEEQLKAVCEVQRNFGEGVDLDSTPTTSEDEGGEEDIGGLVNYINLLSLCLLSFKFLNNINIMFNNKLINRNRKQTKFLNLE